MRLFVPHIGEELTLIDDWRFVTLCEARNTTLFNAFAIPSEDRWEPADARSYRWATVDGLDTYKTKPVAFTLPEGTILKVDRIYIRKGQDDYDSLTFIVADSPDKRLLTKKHQGTSPKPVRFWVKLKETRTMEVKVA